MKDKVALITGSVSGLGKRTARELAAQGAHIVLNHRQSADEAQAFACELEQLYGVQTACIAGDITRPDDCEALVQGTLRRFGRVDILVNNAGPYVAERKPLVDYELDEWNYIVNGNLNSAFYLCKLTVPEMRKGGWGRIVNIGFDRAETAPGWMFRSAFAAAKTGLVSLTKTLALEEAAHGITVNMVCPGDIRGHYKEADIAEVRDLPADPGTPVGRIGAGQDIARTIAFLCHADSDFITGSVIAVTGGKDVLNKYRYE